jgi:hypothetical protein
LKYNSEIDLYLTNNKINIYDYLNCSNAMFLSKCELKHDLKISGKSILKKLSVVK